MKGGIGKKGSKREKGEANLKAGPTVTKGSHCKVEREPGEGGLSPDGKGRLL